MWGVSKMTNLALPLEVLWSGSKMFIGDGGTDMIHGYGTPGIYLCTLIPCLLHSSRSSPESACGPVCMARYGQPVWPLASATSPHSISDVVWSSTMRVW